MLEQCADPGSLQGLSWLMCYLTSGKHILFYLSFGTVLLLLAITAPIALLFGLFVPTTVRIRIPTPRERGCARRRQRPNVPPGRHTREGTR